MSQEPFVHCSSTTRSVLPTNPVFALVPNHVDREEYAFTIDGASPEVAEVNAYDGER